MANRNFHPTANPNRSDPASFAVVVTPSDGTDLSFVTRAVYVGTGGDLNVDMDGDGATRLFVNVQSGSTLPISVRRIRSSSTSALNIMALW
jgi:hypothetical protein